MHVTDNGTKWRALPADFPPWSTVYKRFQAWARSGAVAHVMGAVNDRTRIHAGRSAAPSSAVIDSQSVKAAEDARPREPEPRAASNGDTDPTQKSPSR